MGEDFKMKRIRFYCDNGANIESCRSDEFTPKELGLTDQEWQELTEDEKYEMVRDWAFDKLDYGYEEL